MTRSSTRSQSRSFTGRFIVAVLAIPTLGFLVFALGEGASARTDVSGSTASSVHEISQTDAMKYSFSELNTEQNSQIHHQAHVLLKLPDHNYQLKEP